MGHKSHPLSLRVGYSMNWRSRWFDAKNYRQSLLEDYRIRRFLNRKLRRAALAGVEIERFGPEVQVTLLTARPGVVIGHGGSGIEELRKELVKMVKGGNLKLSVQEVKNPEADAAVIAATVVEQIERRIPFRRSVKAALENAMRGGALGIKILISGRLNGAEISRSEQFLLGTVPLHTFRVQIDYAANTAFTTYGTVGIKVWVYRKEERGRGEEGAGFGKSF